MCSGLNQPWSGEITINGALLSEISRKRLRRSVTVVDQSIFLFEGTIQDNMAMWNPTLPDTPGARARNEAVRASKYLGSALWRQVTGYHRRSRVETKPLGIMLRITLSVSGCNV
jgi:ABC-type multidrug transport system fused ATPase/permease subunit